VRIAAIQSEIVWEDPEENFKKLRPWIAVGAAAGARLIALPEMFACGFSMATERISEAPGGATTEFLQEQARVHGLWICGSLPELPRGAARPYNTMVIAGPQGELHRYQKIHPFTFAGEHLHYAAGEQHLTLTIEGARLSFFICYDLRFADEIWGRAPESDGFVFVANWPARRRLHWSALLRARAIENQVYVVGVNRVGSAQGLEYSGDSAIIDPWGELLVSAAGDPTILIGEIDPGRVAEARAKLPVMQDRRLPAI